jgi:hypothetical protein
LRPLPIPVTLSPASLIRLRLHPPGRLVQILIALLGKN